MTSDAGRTGHGSMVGERPCPGHQVVATYDLPPGRHSKPLVPAGTVGTIVRTPAYFCTTYSIAFTMHGTDITLHGIHRYEFRIHHEDGAADAPGFPPFDRYPQPHRVRPAAPTEPRVDS